MTEPGRIGPEPPEPADLLAPVRMVEPEPIASRLRESPGRRPLAARVNVLDQPVAPLEPDHVAGAEGLLGRVLALLLLARALLRSDRVPVDRSRAHPARGRASSKSSSATGTNPE